MMQNKYVDEFGANLVFTPIAGPIYYWKSECHERTGYPVHNWRGLFKPVQLINTSYVYKNGFHSCKVQMLKAEHYKEKRNIKQIKESFKNAYPMQYAQIESMLVNKCHAINEAYNQELEKLYNAYKFAYFLIESSFNSLEEYDEELMGGLRVLVLTCKFHRPDEIEKDSIDKYLNRFNNPDIKISLLNAYRDYKANTSTFIDEAFELFHKLWAIRNLQHEVINPDEVPLLPADTIYSQLPTASKEYKDYCLRFFEKYIPYREQQPNSSDKELIRVIRTELPEDGPEERTIENWIAKHKRLKYT